MPNFISEDQIERALKGVLDFVHSISASSAPGAGL